MWALVAVAGAAEPSSMMVGHFQDATVVMLSVAVGELESARAGARTIAKQDTAPDPLKEAAAALADCKKVSCAGPAVAAVGRTCADCHVATGEGPRPHGVDVLPGATARDRHIYAALFAWI